MAPLYYRGAAAAIMVFSLNDATSFEKLKEWVRELMSNVEEQLVLAIAANKCDLADRAVPAETLKAYADSIGALLFETSAKSNHGVRNVVGVGIVITLQNESMSCIFRSCVGSLHMAPPTLAPLARR